MNELALAFADYLQDILGITVKPEKWDQYRSLPVFLHSIYDFYTVRILSQECLLLVGRTEQDTTPAAMQKHYELVQKKWRGLTILVRRSIRSNDRQRLAIQYKLPFVVPGNQLYLPHFGLDLREHFLGMRREGKPFSPSTQVLVLRALLTRSYAPLHSSQLVRALPYTPMTIKRAFDQIAQSQVGSVRMRGRERELSFETSGHELWNSALPFLRSPVQKRMLAASSSAGLPTLEAGLTALSRYSMISAPTPPTIAISSEAWKTAKNNASVREADHGEENTYDLEIWRYDPCLLSTESAADRLSLFLSLRDSRDERIEAALDEMMERIQW